MSPTVLWRWLCTLLMAASLVACGGNGAEPAADRLSPVQAMARDVGRQAVPAGIDTAPFRRHAALPTGRTERGTPARALAAGDPETPATTTQLFALGESQYGVYFPGPQVDRRASDFIYRYYPQTGSYLIVDSASRIYVFGGALGTEVSFVGLVTDYLPTCQTVTTGFDVSRLDQTPVDQSAGGPGADGSGVGAGVGGNEGAIVGADVHLYDSTGKRLGSAVSDQNGYVRMQACGAIGPFKIEFAGNATAQYFDEGIALRDGAEANPWVPFPAGEVLSAVVENLTDHHIAVTVLTHVAAQRVSFDAAGASVVDRARALSRASSGIDGRIKPAAGAVTAVDVRAANEGIRSLFNRHFAGTGIQIDNIARSTALANSLDALRNFGNDRRGRYGQFLTTLAKSAARFNPGLSNPAREMTKQLARDLSDGVIDGKDSSGAPVAPNNESRAYDPSQLPSQVAVQAAGRLVLDALGQGSITVTASTAAKVTCGNGAGDCYPFGTVVTLQAQILPGFGFVGWAGACNNVVATTCQVTMSGDKLAKAAFTGAGSDRATLRLSVLSGPGSILASPPGDGCGDNCLSFPVGARVTLTTQPAAGYALSQWGGNCAGSAGCTLILTGNRTASASFVPGNELRVSKTGSGSGKVVSASAGIDCGAQCTKTYLSGTVVSLTATADRSSSFLGWSGAGCSGTGSCVLQMDQASAVVATFNQRPSATLSLSVQGSGSVSSFPAGLSACATSCAASFVADTAVALVPRAADGWAFVGWSDPECPGTDACPLAMTDNRSITANFGLPRYLVIVSINGLPFGAAGLRLSNASVTQDVAGGATSVNFGPFASTASYSVRITRQPTGYACTLSNGSGVVASANVSTPRLSCVAGSSQWSWEGGAQSLDSPGVYGTLGVASSSTSPGARDAIASWSRSTGQSWMFGGAGIDASGAYGVLGDLWQFDLATRRWTWVAGSRTHSSLGVYDSLGSASARSMPGARVEAATWVDTSGRLWLFGGRGFGEAGYVGGLDDLWRFDPGTRQWTWFGGGPVVCAALADACLRPAGRAGATTWRGGGNLWLFGGWREAPEHRFNDLWRFDTLALAWVRVRDDTGAARYGSVGVAANANTPGARAHGANWPDATGQLWIYGGLGRDVSDIEGYLADLWRYRPSDDTWTWMGGPNSRNSLDQSVGNTPSWPGSREGPAAAVDGGGRLWLFGGVGPRAAGSGPLNDLWVYDPTTRTFSRVNGSDLPAIPAVYGTLGVPSAAAQPGSRRAAAMGFDASGQLWLFGGKASTVDTSGFTGRRNDLWRLVPAGVGDLSQTGPRPR